MGDPQRASDLLTSEATTRSIQAATSALRFLYTVTLGRPWNVAEVLPMPKTPQKLPLILSSEEVRPNGRSSTIAPQLKISRIVPLADNLSSSIVQGTTAS